LNYETTQKSSLQENVMNGCFNAQVIRTFGLIQALMVDCEAMKAENEHRKSEGLSQAYGENDFFNLSDRIAYLANSQ
jgi:hypothetical protein